MGFNKVFASTFILFGCFSAAYANDPLKDAVMELNFQADSKIEEVELLELGSNKCISWVNQKGWTLGENKKKSGGVFFVQVGSGIIQSPPGERNYINSRQNAYTKAMLDAKGEIISSMSITAEREIRLNIKEGQFGSERNKNTAGKTASLWDKSLSLLNSELDEKLKEKGVIDTTDAEQQRKAKEIAEDTLNSESFKDMIKTTSAMRLKGVRRVYVNESVKKGKQGDICVAALYSTKTQELADAIVSGNLSLAPIGKTGKPLILQIPDWKKGSGVRKLMNTFGTEMLRDESGTYHLVSYAQSGTATNSKNSLSIALNKASTRALAELATFAKENAKLSSALESAENLSELSGGSVSYDSHEAYKKDLSSVTSPINFEGANRIGQWAAKHPVTGQAIVGVIMSWSAKSAAAAKQTKANISNSRNKNTRINSSSYEQSKSFGGSAAGGSSEDDF